MITHVGGNDLDNETVTVDEVVSDYAVLITEAKTKFPNSKLVVAGIPPRHHSSEIRTKVKDYNEAMDKWCKTNGMDFINNEEMFEFKSGEVDKGSYVMTGQTPAVHLTCPATLRMLENMKKTIPDMMLNDKCHANKRSYAEAAKSNPNYSSFGYCNSVRNTSHGSQSRHTAGRRDVICWHCRVPGHTRTVCKFEQPTTCHSCGHMVHKKGYCTNTSG